MYNYYLITSESYSQNEVGEYPMWNFNETALIVSASSDYSYPYTQSFNSWDEIVDWTWDTTTNEWMNWNDPGDLEETND